VQGSTLGTPTADHSGTIFVAIELSQKTWQVTLQSLDRGRIFRRKPDGGDHTGLKRMRCSAPGSDLTGKMRAVACSSVRILTT